MKLDGITYVADPQYLAFQEGPVVGAGPTKSSAETVHTLAAPAEKKEKFNI